MRKRQAPNIFPVQRTLTMSGTAWVELCILLALPVWALVKLSIGVDWRLLAGSFMLASFLAYLAHTTDKRRVVTGAWRIPESILHLTELLGGWPGAFLAQRRLRHKTAKISYQVVFWAIVIMHQWAALDLLLGWRLSKGMLRWFTNPG